MTFQPEAIRAFEHAGWQRAASRYEATFAHATARYIEPLLEVACVAAGRRVLDVACGPGQLAAAAARRGARVHALDFSAAMVRIARDANPGIVVSEGDAERMPYADEQYDAVVSSFGMHHVPRPEMALAECRRVLVPGGIVGFTVWAAPAENIAWKLIFDAIDRHGDRSAARAFPPSGALNQIDHCVRALEGTGFAAVTGEIARATWILPDGQALVAALSAGTVRMAALLDAQTPQALSAIVADIDRRAERYRQDGRLALPIAAVLASGRKPAP
ncbi:MAG: class I SAM-dependent methyltransferase [Alphaproteobacteria bacterium]|nr:class I SAM-dependent methyltransferase [Alphaproteobacteria bacterium]